jgi:transcriptional regulator GlxA family with amidase domain
MSRVSLESLSHIGFLLLPNFSMIALTNALEALRMANQLSRKRLYRWTLLTPDGENVAASNGMSLQPVSAPSATPDYDLVLVCGGINVREATEDAHLTVIRRLAAQNVALGAICTGAFALARSGVINGYRCAIHWENLSSISEEFPKTQFTTDLFVIDRDRLTCTGGTAPLDFMCHLIRHKGGKSLAADVSEQFILDRIRDNGDKQHVPLLTRIGTGHEALLEAALAMETNIENPLPLDGLALELGVSLRHLERLFKRCLGTTPAQYYLDLRLRRARELLLQTNMSVMGVTVACGFLSSSHFSKSYRGLFGYPPSHERRHYLHEEAVAA